MTLEYATKLLRKETSAEVIADLDYYNGFNREKTIDVINEAIELVCDYAERYENERRIKALS